MPALALAYALLGWLSLRVAIPPDYVSLVFVPAGLAFVAALTWGRVGLAGFESQLARHLSQGQKRRVALARLFHAAGAPLWVIWATALCVNLRFVIFSAGWRRYFGALPRAQRLRMAYFAADLNYVLFLRRFPEPAPAPAHGTTGKRWPNVIHTPVAFRCEETNDATSHHHAVSPARATRPDRSGCGS